MVARSVEEGIKRQNTEDFEGSETILYDILMVDIYDYTLVKTHRMYIKGEPVEFGDRDVPL